MRILIVEDDDRIAKPLAEDLRHQHHAVEIARLLEIVLRA